MCSVSNKNRNDLNTTCDVILSVCRLNREFLCTDKKCIDPSGGIDQSPHTPSRSCSPRSNVNRSCSRCFQPFHLSEVNLFHFYLKVPTLWFLSKPSVYPPTHTHSADDHWGDNDIKWRKYSITLLMIQCAIRVSQLSCLAYSSSCCCPPSPRILCSHLPKVKKAAVKVESK